MSVNVYAVNQFVNINSVQQGIDIESLNNIIHIYPLHDAINVYDVYHGTNGTTNQRRHAGSVLAAAVVLCVPDLYRYAVP